LFEQHSNGLRREEANPTICLYYRSGFVSVLGWLLAYSVQLVACLELLEEWSRLQAPLEQLPSVEFQVNLNTSMSTRNV
jgi:hypothetical protein